MKYTLKEQINMDRDAFAIKGCHMMGKTVEEASKLLSMDIEYVTFVYAMIDAGWIDFNKTIYN